MARSTNLRLRALWLQVHKWIGISLALLIVPISLSGAALVWHDALDGAINPGRYAVSGPQPALSPNAYAASARAALGPGEQLLSLRYADDGGPIVATAVAPSRGGGGDARPQRASLWLDPPTGRVLDKASADAGFVRFVHNLHGSLTMPGAGRQIVGWVGVFLFVSCLTGLWLWWPLTGSPRRGLRWKRQNSTNANLHHLAGFWIALPLAMLAFTGLWISFPGVFGGGSGGAAPDRVRMARALPLAHTALAPDAALAAARPLAAGALAAITWPTDQSPAWTIAFAREGGPAEVSVADAGAIATPPRAARPETGARLMRRLHDGTGMGPVWRAIIFIAGLIPALLAVTGIVMWLRSRGWRARLARRRAARAKALPLPAE